MSDKKMPLMMTGAISTNGMKGACYGSEEREQMYVDAMRFYIQDIFEKDPARHLVFAENSGWDLAKFKAVIQGEFPAVFSRIEWISVDPAKCDLSKGKGYNELIMMTDAVLRSSAIQAAGAFMKVTGRKVVFNMAHYLEQADDYIFNKGYKYYGDMRDHKVYDILFPRNTKKWNGHIAEEVLEAATNEFYLNVLAPTYKNCNDYIGDHIENVWFRLLKPYRGKADSGMILRLDEEPFLGGRQGSTGTSLTFSQDNLSKKSQLKRHIRNFARKYISWLWI